MPQVLRGNFKPRKSPVVVTSTEDLTTRFEAEALKRLGGSIAFVSKKRFTLGLDGTNEVGDLKATRGKRPS
jgi:hypothetical protein